eukprot:m51a1_g6536 hypothetical protein (740) ;mRNA; r:33905-41827
MHPRVGRASPVQLLGPLFARELCCPYIASPAAFVALICLAPELQRRLCARALLVRPGLGVVELEEPALPRRMLRLTAAVVAHTSSAVVLWLALVLFDTRHTQQMSCSLAVVNVGWATSQPAVAMRPLPGVEPVIWSRTHNNDDDDDDEGDDDKDDDASRINCLVCAARARAMEHDDDDDDEGDDDKDDDASRINCLVCAARARAMACVPCCCLASSLELNDDEGNDDNDNNKDNNDMVAVLVPATPAALAVASVVLLVVCVAVCLAAIGVRRGSTASQGPDSGEAEAAVAGVCEALVQGSSSASPEKDGVELGSLLPPGTATPPPALVSEGSEEMLMVEQADRKQQPRKEGLAATFTTIFAVWNTMIGSSLLSFPWGFTNAGLAGGIAVVVAMGFVTWYTMYLVLINGEGQSDFIDVCAKYLGKPGRWIAWFGSVIILFGADTVMTILLTSTIFKLSSGFYSLAHHGDGLPHVSYWNERSAKAILAAVLVLPLVAVPSFKFAVRMCSCGAAGMMFILVTIVISAALNWDAKADKSWGVEPKFYYLAGIACLCFFAHNFVLQVTHGRELKKAVRDSSIGFALGVLTVLSTGAFAYASIGSQMPQNYFDYYSATYPLIMCSRIALLVQVCGIMPMSFGILRSQAIGAVIGTSRAEAIGIGWRFLFALVLIPAMGVIAVFFGRIGDVMRFVGAVSGFLYVFLLPIGVDFMVRRSKGSVGVVRTAVHGALLLLGLVIIAAQFI